MAQTHEDIAPSPQQKLFASVVLAAIDDAISEERTRGEGVKNIAHWARSRDGQIGRVAV